MAPADGPRNRSIGKSQTQPRARRAHRARERFRRSRSRVADRLEVRGASEDRARQGAIRARETASSEGGYSARRQLAERVRRRESTRRSKLCFCKFARACRCRRHADRQSVPLNLALHARCVRTAHTRASACSQAEQRDTQPRSRRSQTPVCVTTVCVALAARSRFPKTCSQQALRACCSQGLAAATELESAGTAARAVRPAMISRRPAADELRSRGPNLVPTLKQK